MSLREKVVQHYPAILFAGYIILFIYLAIDPVDRRVWFIENLASVGVLVLIVLVHRHFRFSNAAYTLMAVWLVLHTIGGHFTFANVPFDFVNDLFGFERNNYDRFAHAAVGLYAFAIAEYLTRQGHMSWRFAAVFAFSVIMTVAAVYEIIEWAYAVIDGGDVGMEFLGSQGDIWDAQKDMCCDGVGALVGVVLFALIRPDRGARKV